MQAGVFHHRADRCAIRSQIGVGLTSHRIEFPHHHHHHHLPAGVAAGKVERVSIETIFHSALETGWRELCDISSLAGAS